MHSSPAHAPYVSILNTVRRTRPEEHHRHRRESTAHRAPVLGSALLLNISPLRCASADQPRRDARLDADPARGGRGVRGRRLRRAPRWRPRARRRDRVSAPYARAHGAYSLAPLLTPSVAHSLTCYARICSSRTLTRAIGSASASTRVASGRCRAYAYGRHTLPLPDHTAQFDIRFEADVRLRYRGPMDRFVTLGRPACHSR